MRFNFTPRDIADLERKHEAAAAFLRARSLLNEYRNLWTPDRVLSEHEQARMQELETLCGFTFQNVRRANEADTVFELYEKNN